jgi:anti-sigma factor (TIGR02949 family)
MECHRVREVMFRATDNELEPELQGPFREHLRLCPECAHHYCYVTKLIGLIRERCGRLPAPSRLKVRILSSFPHRGSGPRQFLE